MPKPLSSQSISEYIYIYSFVVFLFESYNEERKMQKLKLSEYFSIQKT